MGRPRVLVIAPYFLPSRQGGGSVRALDALTRQLSAHYEFVVATGRRDLHSHQDFDDDACDQARRLSALDIRYLSKDATLIKPWRELLAERWDLVYVNSLMSPRFTALPLWLARGRLPVLLAPRGEWMPGALSNKPRRKHAWLQLLRASGCLRGVQWQATSAEEAKELRRLELGPVWLAPDFPPSAEPSLARPQPLPQGPLALIYLSRIDRNKNLGQLLQALQSVRSPVRLSLYGPVADTAYWKDCLALMARLPAHVQAHHGGALPPEQVLPMLQQQELFVLPTRGESHGYAVAEALMAGCPVLLSDRTPWSAHAQGAALQVEALDDVQGFAHAIDAMAALAPQARLAVRQQAQQLGLSLLDATAAMSAHRRMLDALCGMAAG